MVSAPKKPGKLLIVFFLFVVLGLIVLGLYLLVKGRKVPETLNQSPQNLTPTPFPADITSGWETYFNPEFGFILKYPRFLYPIEIKKTGGYLIFVRFLENNFSQGKGVAVGVRETTLRQEVEEIKKEIKNDIEATMVNEDEFMANDLSAVKLVYEPRDPEQGEPRAIMILNNDQYSFSISTTPEQIDAVVASFSLNENFKGCKDILSSGGEQPFLQAYCLGNYCFEEKTKETCETVDVVKFAEGGLFEENGKDGIGDCVWDETVTSNQCQPRF